VPLRGCAYTTTSAWAWQAMAMGEIDAPPPGCTNPTSCLIGPPPAARPCWPQTLAELLVWPFAGGDATTLTEAGYARVKT